MRPVGPRRLVWDRSLFERIKSLRKTGGAPADFPAGDRVDVDTDEILGLARNIERMARNLQSVEAVKPMGSGCYLLLYRLAQTFTFFLVPAWPVNSGRQAKGSATVFQAFTVQDTRPLLATFEGESGMGRMPRPSPVCLLLYPKLPTRARYRHQQRRCVHTLSLG